MVEAGGARLLIVEKRDGLGLTQRRLDGGPRL
jgi:hypothetical protein